MALIDEKRAELAVLEKRSRRKLKRNEAKGVRITGSRHDPTKGAPPNSLSVRQLDARIARNQKFLSRKSQFHRGAKGAPITARAVRGARRAAKVYNSFRADEYNKVSGALLPGQKQTVDDRHYRMRTKRPNLPVRDGWSTDLKINPAAFLNEGKLREYSKYLRNSGATRFARESARSRDVLDKMIASMNGYVPPGWDELRTLDDRRFMLVWAHSPAIKDVITEYMGKVNGYVLGTKIYEDAALSIQKHVDWAKSLDLK